MSDEQAPATEDDLLTLAGHEFTEHVKRLTELLTEERRARAADEERLRAAERRVWGDTVTWGCDAPDHLADAVLEERRARAEAEQGWRCFHCGELFVSSEAAREHFGERTSTGSLADPAWCQRMLDAIGKTLSEAGMTFGVVNAAPVRALIKERDDARRARAEAKQESDFALFDLETKLAKAEQENARLRDLLGQARPPHYPGECAHCGMDQEPAETCSHLALLRDIDAALLRAALSGGSRTGAIPTETR